MSPEKEGSREKLILALNEIYHDLENQAYTAKHPDIFEDEISRWRRLASTALAGHRSPFNILDIGSGTGFVPLQLQEWLRPDDMLTCSDISTGMLNACKDNLKKSRLDYSLTFLKLDGGQVGLPDQSQDLITLNAVLHHLPKPEFVCQEIDRLLKPGGQVWIGHEPTVTYANSRLMLFNYWMLLPFMNFKLFCYEIILRLGWFETLRHPLARYIPELKDHNLLLQAVNERLLAGKFIHKPLPADTLSSLLDAQSPTAGGPQKNRGFSREIYSGYFPDYKIEFCETYTHLNKILIRNNWLERYARWLALRFPESGANIFCCLRKSKKREEN